MGLSGHLWGWLLPTKARRTIGYTGSGATNRVSRVCKDSDGSLYPPALISAIHTLY